MYGGTGDGGDDESMNVEQISRQLEGICDNPDHDTFEEDNGDSDETDETRTDDDGDESSFLEATSRRYVRFVGNEDKAQCRASSKSCPGWNEVKETATGQA